MKLFLKIPVRIKWFCLLFSCVLQTACTKSFLDAKSDKKLALPETIDDMQALLDNTSNMNYYGPSAPDVCADDYYVKDNDWLYANDVTGKNLYLWGDNVFNESIYNDWFLGYQTVFYANTVLNNIGSIEGASDAKNYITGQALFFRAKALFEIAQVFAQTYSPSNASSLPGIPVRTEADIRAPTTRPLLEESYRQITTDLKEAAALLPEAQPVKTRPSKPAAFAMLARVYLVMQQYDAALSYTDSCLAKYDKLIDYNTLDAGADNPLPFFNDEVIFHSASNTRVIVQPPMCMVDTSLIASYTPDDLRRTLYYKTGDSGVINYCGSYTGSYYLFNGLATDEVYLINAECNARAGNTALAMSRLNNLLVKRFATGSFVPLTAANKDEALTIIINERRKELVFRGLRWTDIRRLNAAGYAITLQRKLDGEMYQLSPNDLRYALLIPVAVIQQTGIAQNPR